MRSNTHSRDLTDRRGREFRDRDRGFYDNLNAFYLDGWDSGVNFYDAWQSYGFFGGYYWGFRPYLDIDSDFWNPSIAWFFATDSDDDYNAQWYGDDYNNYPGLHEAFRYPGVFMPTEDFRDLNLSISMLDPEYQSYYRSGINELYNGLVGRLATLDSSDVRLGKGSVMVNHYQLTPEDRGQVIEGVVNPNESTTAYAFKAAINLRDGTTIVFVPSGAEPNEADIASLEAVNQMIADLGGEVEVPTGSVVVPKKNSNVVVRKKDFE